MSTAAQTFSQTKIRAVVEEAGVVRHGHFQLASGKHSDTYIERFRILERPSLLEKICAELVDHSDLWGRRWSRGRRREG